MIIRQKNTHISSSAQRTNKGKHDSPKPITAHSMPENAGNAVRTTTQRIAQRRNFSAPNDLFIFLFFTMLGNVRNTKHTHTQTHYTIKLTFVRHAFCHPPNITHELRSDSKIRRTEPHQTTCIISLDFFLLLLYPTIYINDFICRQYNKAMFYLDYKAELCVAN